MTDITTTKLPADCDIGRSAAARTLSGGKRIAVAVAFVALSVGATQAGEPMGLLPPSGQTSSAAIGASNAAPAPRAPVRTAPVQPAPALPPANSASLGPDGYPNIGYDPAHTVVPLKSSDEQQRDMEALRALSQANGREGAGAGGPSFASRLRDLRNRHRADALRKIEGGS